MKHNPFYYVVCLENTWTFCLKKKKNMDRKNVQANK